MGLFNLIRRELIEVIEWSDATADTMLWKFPDKDKSIKYGANLTVRESQVALFLDQGQFADTFEPGRFELITDNIPLLTTLQNWKTGFKSPFLCDIYFLSTKIFTGLKWGTPNPIIMRDPQFKQVRVKAFGTYFIKIVDPQKFFTGFSGATKNVSKYHVEESMRDIISSRFAEALSETGVSVLDMVSNYTEIGEKIAPILQSDFDDFGIELTKFQVASTSLPVAVEEFYDKMTNMNMVEDVNKFQQITSAQAMEKAAENEGGAGDGLGMALGFNMADKMMGHSQEAPDDKAEIMKTLKELGELKDAGVLTQEEFDDKKKDLLSRL